MAGKYMPYTIPLGVTQYPGTPLQMFGEAIFYKSRKPVSKTPLGEKFEGEQRMQRVPNKDSAADALIEAITAGDEELVRELITRNQKLACNPDRNYNTPLHAAASSGNPKVPEVASFASSAC
jgi:hypothetical protein